MTSFVIFSTFLLSLSRASESINQCFKERHFPCTFSRMLGSAFPRISSTACGISSSLCTTFSSRCPQSTPYASLESAQSFWNVAVAPAQIHSDISQICLYVRRILRTSSAALTSGIKIPQIIFIILVQSFKVILQKLHHSFTSFKGACSIASASSSPFSSRTKKLAERFPDSRKTVSSRTVIRSISTAYSDIVY